MNNSLVCLLVDFGKNNFDRVGRMDTKQIEGRLYYCTEKRLKFEEVIEFAEQIIPKLWVDAEKLRLEFTGPLEFLYFDTDGDTEKPFDLCIGFPVKERVTDTGDYSYLETMPYTCLSLEHRGSIADLDASWKGLVQEAVGGGYILASHGREIYKQWDEFSSPENILELQIGVLGRKL